MSAECWFPLLQQLQMNWIEPQQPPEMWAGMWLVVPRSYEQGRENLFFQVILAPDSKSFEVNWGLWIRPLYKQPLFPDKGKKKSDFLWHRGFGCIFFLFKGGRKPPKTCICFPLKIVLLAGDHLSCVQALKCTFSLSSFLTTEETGCTLPSATPGTPSSTWWKISTSDGQGWCTALSITSRLLPVTVFSMGPASSSSTSTEHWGEPVRVPRWTGSKPLGFFSFQFWFFLSLSHS